MTRLFFSRKDLATVSAAFSRGCERIAGLPKSPKAAAAPLWILTLVAVLLTTILVWASTRLENTYLNNYGFFYDPAAYYMYHIQLYQEYLRSGAATTILHDLTVNSRCPWRTIPYLLLAPELLATVTAHLWTEVPLLFSFLTLLSFTVYIRTRSVLFAIASTAVFSGIPFLYDPAYGIASFWLDLTAALSMGCAALCLVQFADSRNNLWMFGVGVFATLTVTSRWSAAGYLILFLPFGTLASFASRRIGSRAVAISLGSLLITALPGVYFISHFLQTVRDYYSTAGYAFNAPISQSVQWTLSTLQSMFGGGLLIGLIGAIGLHVINSLKNRSPAQVAIVFICAWMPISVFIFLCVITKAINGTHPLVYFAPALLISAFCPFARLDGEHYRWWQAASCTIIVASIANGITSYEHFRRIANSPAPLFRIQKQTDVALGKFIAKTRAPSFLQLDTQTIMPQLEAFYSDRVYSSQPLYFSNHEFHLRGLYPNRTPQEVAVSAYDDIKNHVALVAVFQNPDRALQPEVFPYANPYTTAVSHFVSRRVSCEANWKFLGTVNGARGVLAVYQNLTARPE